MTASAVVLSPDRTRVVLVYHERLARWLQPGGHVEPYDADLIHTARREVEEETNLSLAGVVEAPLVSVDVHEIPAINGEPPHMHHDLTFVLVLKTDQSVEPGDDQQAAWCPIDRLDGYGVDSPVRTSLKRALHGSGLSVGSQEDV
jgi:8-oxo-dGTP pyrophosphatase MutT (NUDIX family)